MSHPNNFNFGDENDEDKSSEFENLGAYEDSFMKRNRQKIQHLNFNNSFPKSDVAHDTMIIYTPHEFNILMIEKVFEMPLDDSTVEKETFDGRQIHRSISTHPIALGRYTMNPANFKIFATKVIGMLEDYEEKFGEIAIDIPQNTS